MAPPPAVTSEPVTSTHPSSTSASLRDRPSKTKIASGVEELIGWTPLVELKHVADAEGAVARIIGKLEGQQPGCSVKDRIVLEMILDAEAKGLITPGVTTLVEPTSGNTGLALAMVGKKRGYKVILAIPHTYSMERRMLMRFLGAEVAITDAGKGVAGVLEKTNEILTNTPNSYMLNQFSNPANPEAHFKTTGPEIWEDTAGKVDIFVAGAGTGGTFTGAGRFLKSKNPSIHLVVVEPAESAVLSGAEPGPHKIQGIGPGFIPDNLDTSLVNQIVAVKGQDAIAMAQRLALEEGLLVGISSGAAFYAALQVAQEPENAGKTIVVMLPSAAERYLSTALFATIKDECEQMTFE